MAEDLPPELPKRSRSRRGSAKKDSKSTPWKGGRRWWGMSLGRGLQLKNNV